MRRFWQWFKEVDYVSTSNLNFFHEFFIVKQISRNFFVQCSMHFTHREQRFVVVKNFKRFSDARVIQFQEKLDKVFGETFDSGKCCGAELKLLAFSKGNSFEERWRNTDTFQSIFPKRDMVMMGRMIMM